MNPRLIAFSILFAPVFAFSLYLLACTASIYPSYQSDIARIRWFHPGLILVISFIVASCLARHRREVVHFLQLALISCAIVFIIVAASYSSRSVIAPISPAERTLYSVVGFALAQPQFSNRSIAAPFYSAVLVAILWRCIAHAITQMNETFSHALQRSTSGDSNILSITLNL